MRLWPPLQLLCVTALLLIALVGLLAITNGRKAETSMEPLSETTATRQRTLYLEIVTTGPVQSLEIRDPFTQLHRITTPFHEEEMEIQIEYTPPEIRFQVSGRVEPDHLPLALRIVCEPDGLPNQQEILWVREETFSATITLTAEESFP